jgi:hypothetical protein
MRAEIALLNAMTSDFATVARRKVVNDMMQQTLEQTLVQNLEQTLGNNKM